MFGGSGAKPEGFACWRPGPNASITILIEVSLQDCNSTECQRPYLYDEVAQRCCLWQDDVCHGVKAAHTARQERHLVWRMEPACGALAQPPGRCLKRLSRPFTLCVCVCL